LRTFGRACVLLLASGCADDDAPTPATIDTSLMDSGLVRPRIDAASYEGEPSDAATLEPPCATIDVCGEDGKPGLLYNVCITGTASGTPVEPACVFDPSGVLYLAPLNSGQVLMTQGWRQSNNATLSAEEQARCTAARATLLVDAGAMPKCAGGS
jgi:hypothetical protein